MRLIDAENLMTVTDIREDGTEITYVPYSEIESAPTAYDVDAVVKQLEEEQEKLDTSLWAVENGDWYAQRCNGINDGLEKAIEIVEGGGVDAKTDS